ncbi:MAG: knotted carbamoyltransferase YgeW, partial [Bacteroidota bacterium]
SVPQGIIGLMTRLGMQVDLAYPEGYGLIPEVTELAGKQANESGGKFQVVNSMEEAFAGADIVYPKSWAPFHVMERRTVLLRNNDHDGLKGLEKECLANNASHKNWECTEDNMKFTREGKALYMHCLPADISGVSCREGEVAASVFDRYRVPLYKQAGFKPYIIAAMMLTNRFADPAGVLQKIASSDRKGLFRSLL